LGNLVVERVPLGRETTKLPNALSH
jgi:hypothetical protein